MTQMKKRMCGIEGIAMVTRAESLDLGDDIMNDWYIQAMGELNANYVG